MPYIRIYSYFSSLLVGIRLTSEINLFFKSRLTLLETVWNIQKSKRISRATGDLSSTTCVRDPRLSTRHGTVPGTIQENRPVSKATGWGWFSRYAATFAKSKGQEQARWLVRVHNVCMLHVLVPSLLVARRQVPGARSATAGNESTSFYDKTKRSALSITCVSIRLHR